MTYLIIGIVVYLLTIVAYLWVEASGLKEEQAVVTIEDAIESCEFYYFIPVFNTVMFVSVFISYIIWEKCRLGSLCSWIWNKIKDIKL